MLRQVLMGFAATILLTGCGDGETYAMPAKDVRSALLALRPPMFVFGQANVTSMVSQYGTDRIRWTLIAAGKPLMSFTATVTPSGDDATSVAISTDPAPGKEATQIGRNMNAHPEIIDLYQAAMVEQVDARLERRNFDMSKIQPQMVAAAMVNLGEMQAGIAQSVRDSDEAMKDAQAEMIEDDYVRQRDEALAGTIPTIQSEDTE